MNLFICVFLVSLASRSLVQPENILTNMSRADLTFAADVSDPPRVDPKRVADLPTFSLAASNRAQKHVVMLVLKWRYQEFLRAALPLSGRYLKLFPVQL